MRMKFLIAVLSFAMALTAQAHAPKVGRNGGQQADAGQYHVEAVTNGKALTVFIHDHNEKPVSTKGFKGTAILVVQGKSERILLTPEPDNRLIGTATVDLEKQIKGAVQITNNLNGTVQATF